MAHYQTTTEGITAVFAKEPGLDGAGVTDDEANVEDILAAELSSRARNAHPHQMHTQFPPSTRI